MDEKIGTLKACIEGPRWARSDRAIKKGCWSLGLECKIERETTLFSEIVRFEVKGKKSKLPTFKRILKSSVKNWNS